MGFSVISAHFIASNSHFFKGKDVLSLGNPFGSELYFPPHLSSHEISELYKLAPHQRSRHLMMSLLGVSSFKIADICCDEDPDYELDLGRQLLDTYELDSAFDVVLDLGTQEHVFDNTCFLRNVYRFLRPHGLYLFDLPCNNYLEHGFRQYSPTYFYDLCACNPHLLEICSLSLSTSKTHLNVLPLYRLNDKSESISLAKDINEPNGTLSNGKFTSLSIEVFNRLRAQTGVFGAIRKLTCDLDSLSFEVSQCFYRNLSKPSQAKPVSSIFWYSRPMRLLKTSLKTIFLVLPCPILKLRTLSKLSRILD